MLIRFPWTTVAPDPVQYKPYNPIFTLDGIYVEIPVPVRFVVEQKGAKTVLTPDGVAYCCKQLATSIQRGHQGSLD